MKEVLIKGWFGQKNIGDDLLLNEALYHLPSEWTIQVEGDPLNFIDFLHVKNLKILNPSVSKKAKATIVIYHGGGIYPSLNLTKGTTIAIFKDLIYSRYLFFIGIGISPKKGIQNLLYRLFFKKARLVTVRDDVSKKYLNDIGISNVVNSGDLIWMNKDVNVQNSIILKRKTVLICLAQPFPLHTLSDSHIKVRFYNFLFEIKKVIQYLLKNGFFLSFVPFLKVDDQFLIDQITMDLEESTYDVLKVGHDFQLDNINQLFQQADYAFCMRFHSKLLSIKNQLPFVGICYDYKSECLLEECEISEVGVRYGIRKDACFGMESEIDSDYLIEKFEYIFNNRVRLKSKMDVFSNMKALECNRKYAEMINMIQSI